MYEWDEHKRRSNFAKHGVDFDEIHRFEWDWAIVEEDDTAADEQRMIAAGPIGDRIHIVVFAEQGDQVRVISLRPANKKECKRYVAQIR